MTNILRFEKLSRGTITGVFLSILVHGTLAGSLYYGCVVQSTSGSVPIVAELDFSMVPIIPMAPNLGGGHTSTPEQSWIVPKKRQTSIQSVASLPETKEEVLRKENQGIPCLDCSQNGEILGKGWGGGTGKGEGIYVPVDQTTKKPRWVGNFISSRDYPLIARQEGKDGRVVLVILIDEKGRVQDARLAQGSYDILNQVALKKIKEAIFSPAYDALGNPVPCKVTLPIRFQLR